MLKKIWDVKFTRFLSVGVFNTLFDLAMLNALVFVGRVPILVANLVSASISIAVSYFLNHRIVFRLKDDHSLKKFFHFFAVTGTGILVIQTLVIYLVTHLLAHQQSFFENVVTYFGFTHVTAEGMILNIAKLTAVLAAMAWNFTIYHFFIFKQPDAKVDELLVP